jgi:hypothetical protein
MINKETKMNEWDLIAAAQAADLAKPLPLDPELVAWLSDPRNFGPDRDETDFPYFEY